MTSRQPRVSFQRFWPALWLPFLALIVVHPLLLHGPSCGHDYGFHVQSWMDASEQLQAGRVLPRWAFSPAFNAGEPRFIFYPPLSWLLGSLLLLLLPTATVTTAYTFLALTAAAVAMYLLARRFTSQSGAVLASALYLGNPYLFFTAFERTAFAELLAAAWLPLLFRAAIAEEISVLAVAVPLALLWLTNAPAAVMGTYGFALVVLLRLGLRWRAAHAGSTGVSKSLSPLRPLLSGAVGGLLLGLALPAFYLVPAAWERRYVQIAMAIIPNMRVEDNFLFGHSGYGPHDVVLHTASVVSVELAGMTVLALVGAFLQQRRATALSLSTPPQPHAGGQPASPHARSILTAASLLAACILLLLWHFTLPVWHLLPELAFLQFPWRLLAVLECVLGVAVALAISDRKLSPLFAGGVSVAIVGVATALAYPPLRQGCEAQELPADRVALFRTHHGVGPTDEYTPTTADNDQLRWHDPAYWLTSQPNAPAPGTVPNPAATDPDYDAMPPLAETISGRAPTHLRVQTPLPEDLVLNLRDYPAWVITVNGQAPAERLQRDDGLLAVALPAGSSTVDVRWRTLPDVWLGDALSLTALGVAGWLRLRSRKIGY